MCQVESEKKETREKKSKQLTKSLDPKIVCVAL